MSRTMHRGLRLALASLIATALLAQLAIGLSRSDLTIVRFFSSFTVLSNISAAVMLVLMAGRLARDRSPEFNTFRGAVTVYMTSTALIYVVILASNTADAGLTEPWVDWTLHIVAPLGVALDWVLSPPAARLRTNDVIIWLIFPATYLAYTLIRGAIVDWYPYAILDPHVVDGYPIVAMWSGVALMVIFVFGALYWWWANHRFPEARPA